MLIGGCTRFTADRQWASTTATRASWPVVRDWPEGTATWAAVAAAAAAVVDDDEDDEWESDEDSMSSSKKKRVVFKGTYPIDRPLVGRSTVNSRKRQQMALTLRSPRTYVIDEPIGVVGVERKGHVVEVSIRLGLSTSASISMSFPILHFLVTCLFIYMLLNFFFFFTFFRLHLSIGNVPSAGFRFQFMASLLHPP